MISIKRYNESNKPNITKDDIEDLFAHSFDLCTKHEIDIAYFDPSERRWAHNDFSNPESESHPDACDEGFSVEFCHNFYSTSELSDFKKYLQLANEIDSDIERAKDLFNISHLSFLQKTNHSITLMIK